MHDRITAAIRDFFSRLRSPIGPRSSLVTQVNERFDALAGDLAAVKNQLRYVEEIASLRADVSELRRAVEATSVALPPIDSKLSEARSLLESIRLESANGITTLSGSVGSRLNELEGKIFEAGNIAGGEFNTMKFSIYPNILAQLHEAVAVALESSGIEFREKADEPVVKKSPPPEHVIDFDQVLARAERDFPNVYPEWRSRLDTMKAAFDITKEGNAANSADVYSRLFRAFVMRHASGAVLDVGCGPFGVPFYLQGYPKSLLSGVEPLSHQQDREFKCVEGISEYLPWKDGAFDTVTSATSLDHCLSLDKSIDEMKRVLKREGKILLWIGDNPGSPEFMPLDPAYEPADRFHLFHFDEKWFLPILNRQFEIKERQQFSRYDYSHVFYCLEHKIAH